jgi:mono/diheme cytochrome c family protein
MSTVLLGVMFLIVGFAAMFLMYHLWGYPFDHTTNKSEAPRWAMYLHRTLGYVFALIYVVMMVKMVPRLWEYQVEFPARTTAHIILGFSIGFLLIVKITIMRFFRHFEEWMPYLGTSIMLGTILLLGLSLPLALQERSLAQSAPGGDVMSADSRARVAKVLPTAGLPPDAPLAELATEKGLSAGRTVLLDKCVRCHDVKTILAKPRPAAGWWDTVQRMGDKPALYSELTDEEQYQVTAYLIAITPDLQKGAKKRRAQTVARAQSVTAAGQEVAAQDPDPASVDLVKAKATFTEVCSGCHDLTDVDGKPPKAATECAPLVQRMIVDNDAKISGDQVKLITAYLAAHYVDKKL